MSDMSKAEKLAAARKKLKEFQNQQKNKENRINSNIQVQQPIPEHDSFSTKQEIPISAPLEEFFSQHVNGDTITNPAPVPTSATEKTITNTIPASSISRTETPFVSSFFTSIPDNTSINISPSLINPAGNVTEIKFDSDKITSDVPEKELNALKLELQLAHSKIKMQTDALDIITAEKEDLQTKLTKALEEIHLCKANMETLRGELATSSNCQKQLEVTVDELERYRENVSTKELLREQNLNDLKEKNDELCLNLQMVKERGNAVVNQLEEVQSNYSMLSLKFQQLGIEVNADHTEDYRSINAECESWKRKYEELENELKTMQFEKEHTNDEYRQYVANLKAELENVSEELRRISEDNQMLANKISSQTEHISALEKQLQKVPDVHKDEVIAKLREEIQTLQLRVQKDEETCKQLQALSIDHEASERRVNELQREVEILKADMTHANELQLAVESSKVAASQAISQNAKLKNEFEQLHQMVQILSEEKIMLSKMLEEERIKNEKLMEASQHKNGADSHEVTTNDAAINTDGGDKEENSIYGKANVEAMLQLQEKFKCVLDKMADLTDEKQQLEHLVLQLQCETETIEEYVALYQKQRSVLQQRARETDLKMERVSQEKEHLLKILRSILTTENFDCAFIKQLVENNLSMELSDELANSYTGGTMENNYEYVQQTNHHPSCPCCSGQLITI